MNAIRNLLVTVGTALFAVASAAQSNCVSPENLMPDCGFDLGISGWQANAGTVSWSQDGASAAGSLSVLSESIAGTGWAEALFCLELDATPPSLELSFAYRQVETSEGMVCGYTASPHSSADCLPTSMLPGGAAGSLELSGPWAQLPREVFDVVEGMEALRLDLACRDTEQEDYELRIDDVVVRDAAAGVEPCEPSPTTLCIDDAPGDRRFQVTMAYSGAGISGDANALPLETVGVTRGGLLYFLNQANPEVLIKVLDGCAITQHYWVFFAATTTLGFDLTVVDTQTGAMRVWSNVDGVTAEPVSELEAFGCD